MKKKLIKKTVLFPNDIENRVKQGIVRIRTSETRPG